MRVPQVRPWVLQGRGKQKLLLAVASLEIVQAMITCPYHVGTAKYVPAAVPEEAGVTCMPLSKASAIGLPNLERIRAGRNNGSIMMVPAHLSHALAQPGHAIARHLAGRCVIALGDSRLMEQVADLGALMGNLSSGGPEYMNLLTRINAARRNQSGPVSFRLEADERNHLEVRWEPTGDPFGALVFRSGPLDAVVYATHVRGFGRYVMFVGAVFTLNQSSVQGHLRASADRWCGARPREVWVGDGDHEMASKDKKKRYGIPASLTYPRLELRYSMLDFLESLAPRRAWLTHHNGCYNGACTNAECGTRRIQYVRPSPPASSMMLHAHFGRCSPRIVGPFLCWQASMSGTATRSHVATAGVSSHTTWLGPARAISGHLAKSPAGALDRQRRPATSSTCPCTLGRSCSL